MMLLKYNALIKLLLFYKKQLLLYITYINLPFINLHNE